MDKERFIESSPEIDLNGQEHDQPSHIGRAGMIPPRYPLSRNPSAKRFSPSGSESTESFRGILRQSSHGNRGFTNQVLPLPGDRSLPTSVATSAASSSYHVSSQYVDSAQSPGPFRLDKRKRTAEDTGLKRKRYRFKRSPSVTAISVETINDTIQYLQTLSAHISASHTISSGEWVAMDLVTQLLQSRYEDINAKEEVDTDAMPNSHPTRMQPEYECRKCAAAAEERLYD